MADELRAKFELDFAVGSSEPLQAIQGVLERIDVALNRLREVTNPFDGLTEPVARATRATTELNETLTRTTGTTEAAAEGTTALAETLTRATATTSEVTESVTAMNGVLEATGAATAEAANGLGRMGTEAEASAARVSTAMERAQAAYRASSMVPTPDEGEGGSGYLSRVRSAGHGFHDAVQSGMGSAFGAAAAGFGVLAPISAAAEYDNDLAHIGIGLDLHGAANQQFMAAYGRRLDALARDTGQTSPELAAAAGFFNREGYSSARLDAVLPQVARIATAYNAAPDAVAKTTFALQENLGIKDTDTSGALAAIALAGKSADLPFEKLAPLFPQVAAAAGQLGVTGRSGVNDLAAAMAVVRKSTGTEGEAATDTRAFIQAITSPHTAKRFAKFGVDLFGTEENARKGGLDPIEAVMQQVNRITQGGQDRKALGELFNNEQDRAFVQAILMHMDQYQQIKARVSGATPAVINQDFETGLESTLIQLHAFEDALSQTERRIGTAFVPVLNVATTVLHNLTIAFDFLDKNVFGLASGLTAGVGSVLAITAALGALGAVLIPLRAGLVLIRSLLSFSSLASLPALINPVTLTIIGVTAAVTAGYLAWRNWDKIKPMLSSLGNWISGWAKTIGGYIMAPLHTLDQWLDHSSIGQAMDKWLAHPAVPAAVPAAPGAADAHGGQFGLHVSHDPALTVRQTSGRPGLVSITPDRGRMVAVP